MTWSILQSKREYQSAIERIEVLSQNPPSAQSEEGRELLLLGFLVDQYEEKEFPISYPNPIEAIKVRMENLGLKMRDLMDIFGDRGTASKILNGQRNMSLSMIRSLANRLSLPADLLLQQTSRKKYALKKIKRLPQVTEAKPSYKKRKP